MDTGDGCITLRMYLITLNYTLEPHFQSCLPKTYQLQFKVTCKQENFKENQDDFTKPFDIFHWKSQALVAQTVQQANKAAEILKL